MFRRISNVLFVATSSACQDALAQTLTPDVRYVEDGHQRDLLDIYTPQQPTGED